MAGPPSAAPPPPRREARCGGFGERLRSCGPGLPQLRWNKDSPERRRCQVSTPELEQPLPLVCSNVHVQMEGYPIEQGAEIEIPLLPPGSRVAGLGYS